MTETEFNELADATLDRIESSLDALELDVDSERKAGGVLELAFKNGSKIIVNRQPAMQEIWVAAKSGGYHFRHQDGKWVNSRDGLELFSALSRYVSEQSGQGVILKP